MAEIPELQITETDIAEWYKVQKELASLKQKESLMRDRIVRGLFPVPKEGVNNHSLGGGYVLKATHAINRTVDEAVLTVLAQQFKDNNIEMDSVIKRKPEVVKSEYNKLTDEQRHVMDQALVIKPGSTSLKIEFSKKEANKLSTNIDPFADIHGQQV